MTAELLLFLQPPTFKHPRISANKRHMPVDRCALGRHVNPNCEIRRNNQSVMKCIEAIPKITNILVGQVAMLCISDRSHFISPLLSCTARRSFAFCSCFHIILRLAPGSRGCPCTHILIQCRNLVKKLLALNPQHNRLRTVYKITGFLINQVPTSPSGGHAPPLPPDPEFWRFRTGFSVLCHVHVFKACSRAHDMWGRSSDCRCRA